MSQIKVFILSFSSRTYRNLRSGGLGASVGKGVKTKVGSSSFWLWLKSRPLANFRLIYLKLKSTRSQEAGAMMRRYGTSGGGGGSKAITTMRLELYEVKLEGGIFFYRWSHQGRKRMHQRKQDRGRAY